MPFAGLGVQSLVGETFEGMQVEIRYTVTEKPARTNRSTLFGATLVIVGECCELGVAVKSIWIDPPLIMDANAWQGPSPWEDQLLAAFDAYRNYDKVDSTLANHLYHPGQQEASDRLVNWLAVPFGQPRLGRLFLRCAVLTAYTSIIAFIVFMVVQGPPRRYAILFFVGLGLAPLYRFIVNEYNHLFPALNARRAWYEEYFRRSPRYEVVPPTDPKPWLRDAYFRKLAAEVLEAGFVHAGDVVTFPAESADIIHCTFLAPDGVSYLVLRFQFAVGSGTERLCVWPANCVTLCQTFDSKGRCFETLNCETVLSSLNRADPATNRLIFPPDVHPLAVFDGHSEAVIHWAKESKASLCPHGAFNQFVARQTALFDHERQIYQEHPYCWRDHIRWYLQLNVPKAAPDK